MRGLSIGLEGHEELHFEIRLKVVNHVRSLRHEVKETINNDRVACGIEPYETVDEYISVMRKNGEYITEFELGMFAQVYGVEVQLCMLHNEKNKKSILTNDDFFIVECFNSSVNDKKENNAIPKKLIKLLFSGNRNSGHFEVLQERSRDCSKVREVLMNESAVNVISTRQKNTWVEFQTKYGENDAIIKAKNIKRKCSTENKKKNTYTKTETIREEIPRKSEREIEEMNKVEET